MEPFVIAAQPQLYFGDGKIALLPDIARSFGCRALLITGAHSFEASDYREKLLSQLFGLSVEIRQLSVGREPTPTMVDAAVTSFASFAPDVVIAVGGGSVIDAGKAIAAMLLLNEPVKDYLEGVGTSAKHPGTKVPFIAVPTTAGTGSEATKNAVLSEIGEKGYKKSLRHNNFVPNVALIDPLLTVSCSPFTTAASGMDAFTQLLESYLSTSANPITDALAHEGLKRISKSLLTAYQDGNHVEARSDVALASYLSGITLANAGLGLVHGFASVIGGFFDIPHGVICSSLMGACNKVTIQKLRRLGLEHVALKKYSIIGKSFSEKKGKSDAFYVDFLVTQIEEWAIEMKIPHLSDYGIGSSDFDVIVSHTDNKNNPVSLEKDEMWQVLSMAH